MSSPIVFIIHAYDEQELADAWRAAIRAATAGIAQVWLSSDTRPDRGIRVGQEWRNRILEQLAPATHVFAIVSPKSWGRPWILWEAGLATGSGKRRPLVPLLFSMGKGDLSGPLQVYEAYSGDSDDDVRDVLGRLGTQAGLDPRRIPLDTTIEKFRRAVEAHQPRRRIEILAWQSRIEEIVREGRTAEAAQLADEMYGSGKGRPKPVDRSVHEHLSAVFMNQGAFSRAMQEVELGLQLGRDNPELHLRKGLIMFAQGAVEAAHTYVQSIVARYPSLADWGDLALLQGRLLKATAHGNPAIYRQAAAAFRRAFRASPSHEEAGGEALAMSLQAGDQAMFDELLPRVMSILQKRVQAPDASFRSDFSLGEVLLIAGDIPAAKDAYARGLTRIPGPSASERLGAKKDAERTARARGSDVSTLAELLR